MASICYIRFHTSKVNVISTCTLAISVVVVLQYGTLIALKRRPEVTFILIYPHILIFLCLHVLMSSYPHILVQVYFTHLVIGVSLDIALLTLLLTNKHAIKYIKLKARNFFLEFHA